MTDWPSDAWQAPPSAPSPPNAPPQWGEPPAGPGPYSGGPVKTNGLAIASLVAGCAQFICVGVGAILAVVFGHVARGQIKRSNGEQGGQGLATAGLILGYIGIALTILGLVAAVIVVTAFGDDIEREWLRDEARDYVAIAEAHGAGNPRDADVLRAAWYANDLDANHQMYLADGTSIVGATNADWERNHWRIELYGDTFLDDAYVCATIPEAAGDRVRFVNGRCGP